MDLPVLAKQIAKLFKLNDIQMVCFDLGIEYDNLPGDTLDRKVQELVTYYERNGNLKELLKYCRQERPLVNWDGAPAVVDNSSSDSTKQVPQAYLRRVRSQSSTFPLIERVRGKRTQRDLNTAAIYVPLDVSLDDSKPMFKSRHLKALTAIARNHHLVLLGKPGSGKSTIVNMLSFCLAESLLHAVVKQPNPLLEQLGAEWTRIGLLPLCINLREFAEWLAKQKYQDGSAEVVWDFLKHWLNDKESEDSINIIQQFAQKHGVMAIFDSLDETNPDKPTILRIIRQSIEDFSRTFSEPSRLLVTCRVLDYDRHERQLSGWPIARLEALSPKLQDEFVDKWYIEVKKVSGQVDDRIARLKEKLQEPELKRLTQNPLLLWMIIQLQAYRGDFPKKRAQLYEDCIIFLLDQWHPLNGSSSFRKKISVDDWGATQFLELLSLIAHTAHQTVGRSSDAENNNDKIEGSRNASDDSGVELDYDLLVRAAKRYFLHELYDDDEAKTLKRATDFAEYIRRTNNGIIQVHKNEGIHKFACQFPHRTFQEYLAGRALLDSSLPLEGEAEDSEADFVTRSLRLTKTIAHWHEPLLLAASQSIQHRNVSTIIDLVSKLQPVHSPFLNSTDIEKYMLAGELLQEIGWSRCAANEERVHLWNITKNNLALVLTASITPALLRERVGLVLAHLDANGKPGDERHGVCTIEPDWCTCFSPGEYRSPFEKTFTQSEPFEIARYAITVWQYRRFVVDPKYRDAQWWSKKRNNQHDLMISTMLADPDITDNQPVRNVSWYEANAFCKWLTYTGHLQGWLDTSMEVRLPTDTEWQLAARWDPETLQFVPKQTQKGIAVKTDPSMLIGRIAPVGLFPEHASPCGALDMTGEVWEWCDILESGDTNRVLRGGHDWNTFDKLSPNSFHDDVGFRVVRAKKQ